MDPESPTELPPPAYDAQDFDRKISVALDRSMDPALQTVPEEWEEWSEERFEAAAAAYPQQREGNYQSSTSPTQSVSRQNSKKSYRVQSPSPLGQSSSSSSSFSGQTYTPQATGNRSRRLPSSPPKERPSWYKEAHLDFPARPDTMSVETHQTRSPPVFHHDLPPDDDFVDDEPLPPFAAVGPSLDGPPFTEFASYPPPPNSRPYSTSPRPSYHNSVTPPAQRRPANQPSFRQRPVASPPLSNSNPYGSGSHMPPMPFDPGLAYARQRQVTAFLSRDDESGPVDPALLYNSAVSSVMKKSRSMQPLKKSLPNRERSNDVPDRRSFDSQSVRSSYTDTSSFGHYQGSSHLPRVTHYAVPSLPTLPTLATQSVAQSFPGNLPTLPTLQADDPHSHQADPRNLSSYYSHSNATQWSQSASSYGRIA